MNRVPRRYVANRVPQFVSSIRVGKRFAHAPATFHWQDPLNSAELFTEEELAIQETARSYCQERMLPRVLGI